MHLQPTSNRPATPPFRPRLAGCVARDVAMATILKSCYVEAFSRIAANIYRSLRCAERERTLAEIFECAAEEDLEQFRRLGELILALGGDAELRGVRGRRSCQMRFVDDVQDFLEAGIAERSQSIDRYETLMARTGDRVVRSVLAGLLSGERRILDRLLSYSG